MSKAASRSNYFHVIDPDRFENDMELQNILFRQDDAIGYTVWPASGDWPEDFMPQMMDHLKSGELCILTTIAHEENNVLSHAMVAFNNVGVIKHTSPTAFYDELNRLGHRFTKAES